MRNGNFLEMCDSEIPVKRIRVNQGFGVSNFVFLPWKLHFHATIIYICTWPLMYQKNMKSQWPQRKRTFVLLFMHRKLKVWQWQKRGHFSHDLWAFYVRSAIFRQQIKRLYNCKKTSATLCIFSKSLKTWTKSLTSYNAITA